MYLNSAHDTVITRKLTDTKEQGSKNNEKFVTSGRKDVLEEFNRSGMVNRSRTITNPPNVQEPETSRTSYKKSELNKTNVNCSLVQDDWDDTETVQGSSKEDDVALLMNKDKRKECEKNEQIEPCVNVLDSSACRTRDDTIITRELANTKEQGSKNKEETVTSDGKDVLKGVLHPWALFLKTLCIFSKNKATSDKVSYGSGQKCSKELKNHSFTSVGTIVVKLQ